MERAVSTILVVMGVSGCGKSTVAGLLAGRLDWPFAEGDDFHSEHNVAKMRSGHPLTDADRAPWLRAIRAWIDEQHGAGRSAIVTCSALKRSYRDILRGADVVFVYLRGDREQIARRMGARHGHFMPTGLLDSQFADLEPPGPDENAVTIDISRSAAELADEIMTRLNLSGTTPRSTR
jgi:carbohydrate kinase (thermoresistant glucokinase family)